MPKSFSKTELSRNYVTTFSWLDNNGQPLCYASDTTSYAVGKSSFSRSFVGTTTAGYRAKRKAGIPIPTLPCTDTILKSEAVPTTSFEYGMIAGQKVLTTIHSNRLAVRGAVLHSWTGESSLNMAWSKLRQSVMDQDLNVAVLGAEASKTSTMIYETARKLALALRALRKGNVKRVQSLLHRDLRIRDGFRKDLIKDLGVGKADIHKYWLELQYGWKPLLMDVHGAAKTLAKTNVPRRDVFHVVKTHASSSESFTTKVAGRVAAEGTVARTGKAWITYRIRNDGLVAANQLGLLNPALVAWELVPFSFVADWFVNIGDVLQESTAFVGLTILDSGSSTKTVTNGTAFGYEPADSTRYQHTDYIRTAGAQTIPRLHFKSNPFSTGHILNGAALLREVTRR